MSIDIPTLRRLLAAASARPWHAVDFDGWNVATPNTRKSLLFSDLTKDDALLAVTAVNSLGPLLDRLEAAEAQAAELRWRLTKQQEACVAAEDAAQERKDESS